MEGRYVDAVLQPGRKKNEFRAVCEMIDPMSEISALGSIGMADRGFCSCNVIANSTCPEKRHLFLIRSKDQDKKGMIRTLLQTYPRALYLPSEPNGY